MFISFSVHLEKTGMCMAFFVFCSSCSKISSHVRRDLFVLWILQASVELWGLENDHRSHSKLFLFCQLRVERWSFLEKINSQYNGIVEFNSLVLQSNVNQLFPEWCQNVQSWCCIFLNWSCKVPLKSIYVSVKGWVLQPARAMKVQLQYEGDLLCRTHKQ